MLFKVANNKFVAENQSGTKAGEREQMLKELAQAYDAYIELVANLKEGTKVRIFLPKFIVKLLQCCYFFSEFQFKKTF